MLSFPNELTSCMTDQEESRDYKPKIELQRKKKVREGIISKVKINTSRSRKLLGDQSRSQ